MAGGFGILGGAGLRQQIKPQRIRDMENYIHLLAKNSLQMDSAGGVDVIGVINVGLAGGFFQGTGTFASPTTALKIYNSGGVGLLEMWGSGTKQVYMDTDGILYADAGNLKVSSTGLWMAGVADFTGKRLSFGGTSASPIAWLSCDGGSTLFRRYIAQTNAANKIYDILSQDATSGPYYVTSELAYDNRTANLTSGLFITAYDGSFARNLLSVWGYNANGSTFYGGTTVHYGLNVGTATGAGTGDAAYSGNLQPYRNSTLYTGYAFVPLTTPLTSTSWDGDSFSTTASTLIDLSAVFGVPAGVKAVLLSCAINDSGSAGVTNGAYIAFYPAGSGLPALQVSASGLANDAIATGSGTVPCDANGDIYYSIAATGASTLDVRIRIWGYFL